MGNSLKIINQASNEFIYVIICDNMTGVSGEIVTKQVNKNTRIFLNFDWRVISVY